MKFIELKKILKRLYREHLVRYLNRIFFSLFLSLIVSASTSAIAWLLDPAVKKIFIEQDKTMALLIPFAIVLAFAVKGLSLYFARTITIRVGHEICKKLQIEMTSNILSSDAHTIESKHSGKYISHYLYDIGLVNSLVSTGVLNLMKDSLTLIVLVSLMFYQNWKLACFAIIMMPLAALVAKSLGKRIGKVTSQSAEISGTLSTYVSEIIKASRMIKIYQQEKFEFDKSEKILDMLKKNKLKWVL